VSWSQFISGAVLIVGLVILAVFTGVSQLRILRELPSKPDLPEQEQRYFRSQARRRLLCSSLLLVLAVLLGIIQAFLEIPAQQIANEADTTPLEQNRPFHRIYTGSIIALLLVLLAVVIVVAIDLWSLRRYALREHQKILADRRAMIARQAQRMRQERDSRN